MAEDTKDTPPPPPPPAAAPAPSPAPVERKLVRSENMILESANKEE